MNALETQIREAIDDRQDWEAKQAIWYQIRHDGVGRAQAPYPNAPNMHFPLVDATIDKHKPFYVQQMYATDTIASFVSKRPQEADTTAAVAQWFDYKLKQESNFEREAISAVDGLLQNGSAPFKVFWNARKNRLEFDACNPMHVIVPKWTEELPMADMLTHVLNLSEAQYRKNSTFNQDDAFIKSIKGSGTDENGNAINQQQNKALREGLTCGQDEEHIVLWEIYTRDTSDWNKIIIKTRSPLKFDEPVRPDFTMPYNQGVFTEGWFPFVQWRGEIKDKGYYSPRGISEILAPFEASICKTWNFKHEHMDFHSRPTFRDADPSNPTGHTGNFKNFPGAITKGLVPNPPPPMPPWLDQEMNLTREMAEYRVQAPDYGILAQGQERRTATEVNAVSGQQQQGTDLRARIFRLDLGDTCRMAWAILLQYGKDSLSYVIDGQNKGIDPQALHPEYEVNPNGSADSWNKGEQMHKATIRFQMFAQNPYIKQGELVKSVLANDDAGLVRKLYQEPEDQQRSEAEDQAQEISIMLLGFPASVDDTDQDVVHIVTGCQWAEQTLKNGEQIEPRMARLFLKHMGEHTQAAMGKKDPQIQAVNQQYGHIIQIMQQIAAQPDPREQPSNVLPMQPGVLTPASLSPGGPVAPAGQEDAGKQAPALMQGLSSLIKAGVAITYEDINGVLAKAGLPPLQATGHVPPIATPPPQQPQQQTMP